MTGNKPEVTCGRWPECQCREVCDYWSGDGLAPVVEDATEHGCIECGETARAVIYYCPDHDPSQPGGKYRPWTAPPDDN